MKIIYPIYFTLSGRGVNWRDPSNRILVTIEYSDDRKLRVGKLERHHMSLPFKFMNGLVSGYFIQNSQYVRVTNLVGFDGKSLIKRCPSCHLEKAIDEFDYTGRYTNGPRDQSNCFECRSSY